MNNTDTLVTFAATTRATRFWAGIDAAGHVAQFWTKEPDPADYPGLAITTHVIMPRGAAGDAAGWEPVGAAPTLPAAAPVPESQPADSDPSALNYLLSDMDAKHWADEFVKLNPAVDHGLMLTWFACAIMTGFDEANRRRDRAAPAAAPVAADAGWISVAERLPECNMKPGTLGVEVMIYPQFERGEHTAFFGCRVTDEANFYKHGMTLGGITHWMPLPPAPVSTDNQQAGKIRD